jgi:hypothetical protein
VEREAFWHRIVDNKYESLVGGWYAKGVIRAYGVSL